MIYLMREMMSMVFPKTFLESTKVTSFYSHDYFPKPRGKTSVG